MQNLAILVCFLSLKNLNEELSCVVWYEGFINSYFQPLGGALSFCKLPPPCVEVEPDIDCRTLPPSNLQLPQTRTKTLVRFHVLPHVSVFCPTRMSQICTVENETPGQTPPSPGAVWPVSDSWSADIYYLSYINVTSFNRQYCQMISSRLTGQTVG